MLATLRKTKYQLRNLKNQVWDHRTFKCPRNLLSSLTFRTSLPNPGIGFHRCISRKPSWANNQLWGQSNYISGPETFKAKLFDCLYLKQTVGIANSFDFDLEILFMQNRMVFISRSVFLEEQWKLFVQCIILRFRHHLYFILKSHSMSQFGLYMFVKRGGKCLFVQGGESIGDGWILPFFSPFGYNL